jgi:hypothetical protein
LIYTLYCGETGIRTPGSVTFNGFQDRRNRPLCHLSKTPLSGVLFVKSGAKVRRYFKSARVSLKKSAIYFQKIAIYRYFMLDSIKSEYIYADYMKNDCNFVRSKEKDNYNL